MVLQLLQVNRTCFVSEDKILSKISAIVSKNHPAEIVKNFTKLHLLYFWYLAQIYMARSSQICSWLGWVVTNSKVRASPRRIYHRFCFSTDLSLVLPIIQSTATVRWQILKHSFVRLSVSFGQAPGSSLSYIDRRSVRSSEKVNFMSAAKLFGCCL